MPNRHRGEERHAADAEELRLADDTREARLLGVSGVPFFAIDRRFGISGAQPTELFASALEQAREAATTAS